LGHLPTLLSFLIANAKPISTVLVQVGDFLWKHSHYLGPAACWLLSLVLSLWLRWGPPADVRNFSHYPDSKFSRRVRRETRSRKVRTRWTPGSIRTHNLHRSYPLALRNQSHFHKRAPTRDTQESRQKYERLQRNLDDRVRTINKIRAFRPYVRSEGVQRNNNAVVSRRPTIHGRPERTYQRLRANPARYNLRHLSSHGHSGPAFASTLTDSQWHAASLIAVHWDLVRLSSGIRLPKTPAELRYK
jgi:hypothetical protein